MEILKMVVIEMKTINFDADDQILDDGHIFLWRPHFSLLMTK